MPVVADRAECQGGTCKHDGRQWVASCEHHKLEDAARHAEAQLDYQRTKRPDLGAAEGLI